ncbi:UDP-N-acetylmuramoyl-tripeptide--D-alanyl-D-alanine ligase [Wolbachia endosymbiont (group E) of Neria commutata]|uniref:UDP-N-acetylmuramoyl-tripeptide--D-alanyl-D- alanine ligase n=1 Tax=Wolbachia endosymbiont (group E) of Neria commutata TaxID=3066149 RepID=UPI00313343AF
MFKWNANNIILATNGKKIGHCNWICSGVSTDTRNIKKGDLFIALKGKNFDGHNFLYEAFSKGASASIVSEDKCKDLPLIAVKDTLKALHDMASYYIRNVLRSAKVIAITGSVGKTTTKDMLHTVLSQYGLAHANDGNLNNNIGLPLTVLKAPENCRYLILEMGMNRAGEIKELSKLCNPDIAVITNVEPAHTENFSSLFDIAQAKLEVLHGLKSNGTLILNKDSEYYDYLLNFLLQNHYLSEKPVSNLGVIPVRDTGIQQRRNMDPSSQATWMTESDETDLLSVSFQRVKLESKKKERWIPVSSTGMTEGDVIDLSTTDKLKNIVTFGRHQDAAVCLLDLRRSNGLSLKIRLSSNQTVNCNLNVQGEHFAYSVLAVAAVVQSLGLDLSKLPLALENFNVTKGRGNAYSTKYDGKQIYLIDDSYNASPASMKAAIKVLGTYIGKRRVALLGDMLELGDESIKFHIELLEVILRHNINKVYTVGKFMLELHKLLPSNIKGIHFDDSNQLKDDLTKIIQNDDVILVKGSRGMKMELIPNLINPSGGLINKVEIGNTGFFDCIE